MSADPPVIGLPWASVVTVTVSKVLGQKREFGTRSSGEPLIQRTEDLPNREEFPMKHRSLRLARPGLIAALAALRDTPADLGVRQSVQAAKSDGCEGGRTSWST
jgi:hypothetical protein